MDRFKQVFKATIRVHVFFAGVWVGVVMGVGISFIALLFTLGSMPCK